MADKAPSKHPIKLLIQVLRCRKRHNETSNLVMNSYDSISGGYDEAWTAHMREQTQNLIEVMNLKPGDSVIDLACGTGYATHLIAQKTQNNVAGVDRSVGMLQQAKNHYGESIRFIGSDALNYLHTVPDNSVDVVTCCWGLGYMRPYQVLRQIRRILSPGGKVGIIDNSVFSLYEILYCSSLAFMENPSSLRHVMRFRFLAGSRHLRLWFRRAGLKPKQFWNGRKSYSVSSGEEAIARLRATGAAAGFEHAADPQNADMIFRRFGEILEKKYRRNGQIEIYHRYYAGIAVK
jgi:ubiquinone/menaquinone biosynthesis C-methylase UbiE